MMKNCFQNHENLADETNIYLSKKHEWIVANTVSNSTTEQQNISESVSSCIFGINILEIPGEPT